MILKSLTMMIALAALTAGAPLAAKAQTATDAHHPSAGGAAPPIPATGAQPGMMGMMPMMQMMNMMGHGGQTGQPGMMGMMPAMQMMPMGQMMPMAPMMNMMGHGGQTGQPGMMGMMPMMQMMPMTPMTGMTGQVGPGAYGMGMSWMGMRGMDGHESAMIDHIEGSIAFLRVELGIMEAQAKAWDDVAVVMRENAKRLAATRADAASAAATPPSLDQMLNARESSLAARLEGTRAIRPALSALYAVLSPDQQKLADVLLGAHLGLMPGHMMAMGTRM